MGWADRVRAWVTKPTALAAAGALVLAVFLGVAHRGLAASATSQYVAGHIVGKVTYNGNAVANECVQAYGPSDYKETLTQGDGTYSLAVLGGSFALRFWDCGSSTTHVPVVYNGHAGVVFDPADPVAITTNGQSVSGINVALQRAGSITVHVQNGSGKPLSNAEVCPDPAGLNYQNSWCRYTNASGNVTMSGIPAGSERLWASYNHSSAAGESYSGSMYYPHTTTFWLAQKINVVAGSTVGPYTFVFPNAPSVAPAADASPAKTVWALVDGGPKQVSP
jgi:hypothetical protein